MPGLTVPMRWVPLPARTLEREAIGPLQYLEKPALLLLFFGTALNWVAPYLIWFFQLQLVLPEWVRARHSLLVALPALLLGVPALRRYGGFAKTGPPLACAALILAGMAWVDLSEKGRGLLTFAAFATTLPAAALVNKHRYVVPCVLALGLGTVVSLAIALAAPASVAGLRFGTLVDHQGTQTSNANTVGAQAALAAVLLFPLVTPGSQRRRGIHRHRRLMAGGAALMIAFLSCGVILTASRSAFIALGAAIATMLGFVLMQARWLIVPAALTVASAALLLALVGMYVAGDSGESLYQPLEARLLRDEESTVGSFGNRMAIWAFAWDVFWQDSHWVWGVGSGGVDKSLGAFFEYAGRRLGADGVWRLHSHNSYIEWALSFGMLGLGLGGWLTTRWLRNAIHLDRRDHGMERRTLAVFCLLLGIGVVIQSEVFWITLGALGWALATPGER